MYARHSLVQKKPMLVTVRLVPLNDIPELVSLEVTNDLWHAKAPIADRLVKLLRSDTQLFIGPDKVVELLLNSYESALGWGSGIGLCNEKDLGKGRHFDSHDAAHP